MKLMRKNKLAFVVASMITLGAVASETTFELNIPSMEADQALLKLSEIMKRQIMISKGVDADFTVKQLKGEYSLQSALDSLLSGTGLVYEVTAEGLIVVSNPEANQVNEADNDKSVEEVVVTGTRLRNSAPTSPVVVITREDMDKQGLVTAADIVRSLPQNFSSVNSGNTTLNRGETGSFSLGTTTADLRGLGPDATLVLVNGRRMAGSPVFDGGQVNLNSIPATAIDRVEVILDGASAIYGSDAIAGVINFILKEDYVGATTKVRYDNSAHDGDSFNLSQTVGWGWDSGNALVALDYRETDGVNSKKSGFVSSDLRPQGGADYRRSGASSAGSPPLIYESFFGFFPGDFIGALPDSFDGTESWSESDLLGTLVPLDRVAGDVASTPGSETTSLNIHLKQEFSESVSSFVDVMYSTSEFEASTGVASTSLLIPASNPFNQLNREVFVNPLFNNITTGTASEMERINISTGVHIDLPFADWQLKLEGTYGIEERKGDNLRLVIPDELRETGNVFANLDALNIGQYLVVDSTDSPERDTKSFELSANGSLFSISGGDVALAVGYNYRPEELDYSASDVLTNVTNASSSQLKLDNQAYFFEASVPLVSSENAIPGVQSLLMSLAGRYEEYEFDGQFVVNGPQETKSFEEFSPKVGLRWDLNDQFLVRASWGESFKAPSLPDLFGRTTYQAFFGTFPIFDPRNQIATTAIFGRGGNSDLEPETSETKTLGFEWRPTFSDGLTFAATYTDIEWDNKIVTVRGFDVGAIGNTAVADALGLLDYNVSVENGGDGDSTTLDAWPTRPANLASRASESLDALVNYQFENNLGEFEVELVAVWTIDNFDVITADSPEVERVETEQGPDKLVMKAHLGWSHGSYGANLFARYSSSYANNSSSFGIETVDKRVEHYITYDITGFYDFGNGLKVTGGMLNLTNQKFPFFDNEFSSYDSRRVDPRGRLIYMEVSKEFEF